jgi:pimeloyl-ACP methyl ester carboxylesterase
MGAGNVVLVHGLSANRLVMWPLQRRLAGEGFQPANWGYRSTTKTCAFHAQRLVEFIQGLEQDSADLPIHMVGHSMGCIVIRGALELYRPPNLGRIVMLAPPNGGSHVASLLGRRLRWVCPTMDELSDVPHSYVNRLRKPEGYPFGIIAAKFDWVIRPSKVNLPGATDYSVVACNHGLLPWHQQTLDQTARFLKTGSFKPAKPVED